MPRRGQHFTTEQRENVRRAAQGRKKPPPFTDEHRAKLSAANVGRPLPEEQRIKIAEALRGRRRGVDATYRAAHKRVESDRGKATGYGCVMCGEQPATDWALDHEFPTEGFRVEHGWWFSLDVEDYVPVCRGCHVMFDRYQSAVLAPG